MVEEILKTAREISADLIVMGSHGHGSVYCLLVGSVTEGVLKAGERPVLLVPAPAGEIAVPPCAALHLLETFGSMRALGISLVLLFFSAAGVGLTKAATLPFGTVFKGREKFDYLVQQARANDWKSLRIGERTAAVGRALVGTRYKSFTLEIDDRIEAPSANFYRDGLLDVFRDLARLCPHAERSGSLSGRRSGCCITSSSIATAAASARANISRACITWKIGWRITTGAGWSSDLTRQLGGVRANHAAHEMTFGWRHYRYLKANPALLAPLGRMEAKVTRAAALPDPEKSRRPDRIETEERRHHRDRLARSARALLDLARRAGLSDERRRAPFHARFFAAQLRQGRGRCAALELPRALPERQRNPGRATIALIWALRPANRLALAPGQLDDESRAPAEPGALGADLAAMQVDDRFADRKPETETFMPFAYLLEGIENFPEMFRRDPGASIADRD